MGGLVIKRAGLSHVLPDQIALTRCRHVSLPAEFKRRQVWRTMTRTLKAWQAESNVSYFLGLHISISTWFRLPTPQYLTLTSVARTLPIVWTKSFARGLIR